MKIDSNVDATDDEIDPAGVYFGGHDETPFGGVDFDGAMDDIRFLNYERHAFAGGLMISKVEPSSDKITLYNAGGGNYVMDGIFLFTDGTQCISEISGVTLTAGDGDLGGSDTHEIDGDCDIGADDAVRLVDGDADNTGGNDVGFNGNNKEWVIDGVCWNDDGSTIDDDCAEGQPMVAAGVWGAGTSIEDDSGSGVRLTTYGDNDGAVSDWEAIPEFGTLLMPVASVLMIIGYNYRKRNNLED